LAGLPYKKILHLNPGFRPATGKGPSKIVIPIENVMQFTENLERSPLNHYPVRWFHYKTRPNETLVVVARKFNIPIEKLKQLNHLTKNNLKAGTHLLLPNQSTSLAVNEPFKEFISVPEFKPNKTIFNRIKPSADPTGSYAQHKNRKTLPRFSEQVAAKSFIKNSSYFLKPGDTIYMVRAKDTLENVAKRFRSSANAIRLANQLNTNKLPMGHQIIIPTHFNSQKPNLRRKSIEPGDTIYMVRHGDTLDNIAKKFHTTPAMLRLANLMNDRILVEGERLVVPTRFPG
jgi:LysM repeat protein